MTHYLLPDACKTMTEVRTGVDATDRELMALIDRRFGYMRTAARIKPDRGTVRDEARKAQVIELRFFGGFKVTDVAKLIGVSVPTVVTDTRVALAWLLARHEENPTTNDDA